MKKFILLLLILSLSVCFCSCRKTNSENTDTETQKEYNITDWFNEEEIETGEDTGTEQNTDSTGITLPDHIW